MKMKQGLLHGVPAHARQHSSDLTLFTLINPEIPEPNFSTITVTLNSVDESPLTGRVRRQIRSERRESNSCREDGPFHGPKFPLYGV
ncbi:hypothetical protein CASFOL_015671 [Castilleja foliolosa]|uniref:Uncharacterized protein n=1 Tax=Castilleja foliolosa TaxID=1961234 RepID=A0ABD3DEQ7_9LAMI